MIISLGVTTSEKRQLDKSVSTVWSGSGTLRNETNVVNPSILIEANVGTIASCNYMTIPAFNRQYFITEIRTIRNGLCLVSGHCDVLSTYKSGIRSNNAIIARSATEGNWNLLLNDPMLKVTNKTNVITKTGFKSFPKNEFSLMIVTLG